MERDQASKFVNDLLRLMVGRNGSDLFLTADFPPAIKVDGKISRVSPQPLTGQHTLQLARAVMNNKQAADFERTKECNFAISPQGVGRFRVNAFMQQGNVGLVMRTIPKEFPIAGLALGLAGGALIGKSLGNGVDKQFVKDVQEPLTPGSSAILFIVSHENTGVLINALEPYNGKIFQSLFDTEVEEELRKSLR